MNSTMKNVFAGVGVICALVAGGYALKAIYGAIYDSGASDQKETNEKEIRGLKAELVAKTAEAAKATEEKNEAVAKQGDAERLKKDSDAMRTMADAQHKAFVSLVTAARLVNENAVDFVKLPAYKGDKLTMKYQWLGDVDFTSTGLKVGQQSFDYVRDAGGNVTDITFKLDPATTIRTVDRRVY